MKNGQFESVVGAAAILITSLAAVRKKRLEPHPHPVNIQDRNGSEDLGYLSGSIPVTRLTELLDNRVKPVWGHSRVPHHSRFF